jgi:hypothetical protein
MRNVIVSMVTDSSKVNPAKPGRWSVSFPVQAFTHASVAFIATYGIARSTDDPWPGELLFFPWMELGLLVWPINVAIWLVAVVGSAVCFFRAMNTSPKRRTWILAFHSCVAGIYLIPIFACVFGTYVGP